MPPELLRGAFRIAILIAVLALITLPLQERSSAEFVVTALAAAVGLAFAFGVAIAARRATRGVPDDKPERSDYNVRDSTGGKKR